MYFFSELMIMRRCQICLLHFTLINLFLFFFISALWCIIYSYFWFFLISVSALDGVKREHEESLCTCRRCGALTKEAAVRQSARYMGIPSTAEVMLAY